MTLTKKKMVRKIGRRTRLKNRDVRLMLDALIDVWTETLIDGEKIEIENLFVLEVIEIDRGKQTGMLRGRQIPPRRIKRVILRTSKHLRTHLRAE
jgi:nucleoid DNA-binding protein